MCPEYGATVAIFPIDEMTLDYLRLTSRDESRVQLVEAYARAQGLFRTANSPDAVYSETIELDLGTIEASLAGPKRPQDRVTLKKAKSAFQTVLPTMQVPSKPLKGASGSERRCAAGRGRTNRRDGTGGRGRGGSRAGRTRKHGAVVIAAITSCT